MACDTKTIRRQERRFNTASEVPTVPTVADHCTSGWLDTDIYVGEWVIQQTDDKVFTRTTAGIREIPWIADTSGNVQNPISLSMGTQDLTINGSNNGSFIMGTQFGVPAYGFRVTASDNDTLTMAIQDLNGIGGADRVYGEHVNSVSGHIFSSQIDHIGSRLFSDDGAGQEIQVEAGLNQASMQFDNGTEISRVLAGQNETQMQYNNGIGTSLSLVLRTTSPGGSDGFIFDNNGSILFGIETDGHIKTNQTTITGTVRSKVAEMPIYDEGDTLIGYVDIKT